MVIRQMQDMLSRLYDAPIEHDVRDFLLTDHRQLAEWTDRQEHVPAPEEEVLLHEDEDGVRLALYLDAGLMQRLESENPHQALHDGNLADFCTALEGVSHFHYLAWSIARERCVSLLELELQAEVDKYASALTLLISQHDGRFPAGLHSRLFHAVSFLPGLAEESLRRYQAANRWAARFCRQLEERFLRARRVRPEAWLGELRRFHRAGHGAKFRFAYA